MYTCIKLFSDHPLTQCYLLEFYRNFKLTLTTPKMSETETKATSTSHQASTLSETQLAKIQASTSAKTCQEDTDTTSTCFTKTNCFNALIQHCTVLYFITNLLKVVRHTTCISYDLKSCLTALKWVREGCTIPFPIIVLEIHVITSPQFTMYTF